MNRRTRNKLIMASLLLGMVGCGARYSQDGRSTWILGMVHENDGKFDRQAGIREHPGGHTRNGPFDISESMGN